MNVAPIKLLRYQFEILQKLPPQTEHKLGANLCRHTFATTAHNLIYYLDMIDRLTGHTGRLDTRGVATKNYIANMANDNRKMFEHINITMLGTEDSESDHWDTKKKLKSAIGYGKDRLRPTNEKLMPLYCKTCRDEDRTLAAKVEEDGIEN
jgi:hypothetical protein